MDSLLNEPTWSVRPTPAFCVKTRRIPGGSEKIFLNFCTCDELPPPKSITETELTCILESDDPGSYKIPISLGDAHDEFDKSGETCTVFDIIVNEKFYQEKIKQSELFRTFVVVVAVDALFDKYQVKVDKENWIVLKNRKHIGEIKSQQIRQKAKPMIVELDDSESIPIDKSSGDRNKRPIYTLMKDSARNPTKIIGVFRLPGVKNGSEINFNVGRDRILIKIDEKFHLDISLPFEIRVDNVSASHSSKEETLTVDLPLDLRNTLI